MLDSEGSYSLSSLDIMGYVVVVQESHNLYKVAKSKTLNEDAASVVWSFETAHESDLEQLVRQKLDGYISDESLEHYEISPELLAQNLKELEFTLASFIEAQEQADAYSKLEASDTMLSPTDEVKSLSFELSLVKKRLALLECEKTYLENKIKAIIGRSAGIEGIATWKTSTIMRIDTEAVKRDYPDVYASCVKETKSRRFCLKG